MSQKAISVSGLTYSHSPEVAPALVDFSLCLPNGSRTILIGENGAGKTTLMQILAGKKLIAFKGAVVNVCGRDVFHNPSLRITFLGTEWALNPVVRSDIRVSLFLDSVGGYRYKERRDILLDILDVDINWRMHNISDGERRRVQLCFGLMAPWDVLLLDEVTVDLDVLVRDDLLNFLKNDSKARGSTILYATHIYDGLDDFPTHVVHMCSGSLQASPVSWPITAEVIPYSRYPRQATLYSIALQWLKEDKDKRKKLEKIIEKNRGRGHHQTTLTNSEVFYSKYDYGH